MIKIRTKALVIFVLSLLFLTACIGKEKEDTIVAHEEMETTLVESFYSGWIPYWDYAAAKNHMTSQKIWPSEVIAFGAMFENGEVYIPLKTEEVIYMLEEIVPQDTDIYLSFVNDIKMEDGTYIQKDKCFLEEQMATAKIREEHLDKILDAASRYNIQGIEIDYENIKKDSQLWDLYGMFLIDLYEACEERGLGLRVVISYDTVKYTSLPKGPHYVVMCYNLYGIHSGPGPKASQEFLELSFELNQVLQPNVSMAFSNNGFSWSEDGEVRAVTKTEAAERALWLDIEPTRDQASKAMYYQYTDINDVTHEVWYADDHTLNNWMEWATQAGYSNHALWRYGD